jgi:DNA-binding beta-propeller fold protein YncE
MKSGATSILNPRRQRSVLAPALLSVAAVIAVLGATPASAISGSHAVSVGLPPTAVAIDHADHTAYVAVSDGVSSQVALVDTSRCKSQSNARCTGDISAVTLPGNPGVAGVAYDSVNHTVYVTDATSGNVSMINARTCNAARRFGCARAPRVAVLGLASPGVVAVDTSPGHDAIYVAAAGGNTVTVLNGKTCNARKSRGCKSVRRTTVGAAPSAIAIDPSIGTVYVANLGGDSVSTLREKACSTLAAACKTHGKTVSLGAGSDPVALVADPTTKTVYVADSGTGAISFINAATCNISKRAGCAKTPRVRGGLNDPEGLALVTANRIAVADAGDDAVVVFHAATCDATKHSGCLKVAAHVLGGTPVAVAAVGRTVYAADSSLSSLDAIAVPRLDAKKARRS